jgi:hypothetical protein
MSELNIKVCQGGGGYVNKKKQDSIRMKMGVGLTSYLCYLTHFIDSSSPPHHYLHHHPSSP